MKVSFTTIIDKWVHALDLTNSLTDLSVIVNRKIEYWIAMSTIIIYTISIYDISNWAIVVGKAKFWLGKCYFCRESGMENWFFWK